MPQQPVKKIKARYDNALHLIKAGDLSQARAELTALRPLLRRSGEVPFHLSRIAHMLGQHDLRAQHLKEALLLAPNDTRLNEAAVEALLATGDTAEALAAHDRLIAAAPRDIRRRVDKALALQISGDFSAAEDLLRDLIAQHPREGALYRILVVGTKIASDDPLMTQMHDLSVDPRAADSDRMHVSYALASTLEQQGEPSAVFAHLHRANALQAKLQPYDKAARLAEDAAIRRFQDGADLTPMGDVPPVRSIFVTGMPRSGTTLVEQILARHAQVTAGGELPFATRLATNLFALGTGLRSLREAPPQLTSDFARGYGQMVRRETGATSGFVTDKAISLHRLYGLLHRALPGACFVVVHRDPRDIAVSIYKNFFKLGTHRYANDLGDIADTIKAFRASVNHWKTRLPGVIYEINYDALVADPDAQTRALVAAVGLEWQDDCLNPSAAGGTVRTLSLQQVRQPIYRRSSRAWRKYETELAPFFEAWGDDAWD